MADRVDGDVSDLCLQVLSLSPLCWFIQKVCFLNVIQRLWLVSDGLNVGTDVNKLF